MKFKFLSTLCLGFVATLTLASCGGQTDEVGNGEIYVDKEWNMYETGHTVTAPIQIDFWSANSAVDVHGRVIADMCKEFNQYQKETYPDSYITVRPAFQNGYNNQNSKLQAALIGNTNPDIAMVGVSSMALYKDNAIDMREIFTYDQIRDIFPGFLQFAMYKHKFVAYPFFAATNCLVVNRNITNSSNVVVPTVDEILSDTANSTWTWDLFEDYLEDIRDVEAGIYGGAMADIPLYESFYTRGVPVYNEECTKALLDNEVGLEAFTYWQKIVKNDWIKNPVLDPNHGTRIQGEFPAGKTGMYFASSSVIKTLFDIITGYGTDTDPTTETFEMDVLPFPKKTNFYSNQSGGGLILFNNKPAENTKATVEFMRWLQAPEQSAYYSTNTGYLATTRAALETDIWKEYKKINPLLDRVVSLMDLLPPENVKVPLGRAKALADNDYAKYSRGLFLDGCTRDPAAVLKECQDRVGYVLDTNS